MDIKFEGPAILVKDMEKSRAFYEGLLKQEVLADFIQNIPFKSGFSIWKDDHATDMIFGGKGTCPAKLGQNNFEMYFETDELENVWEEVDANWTDIIHPIQEAPWLQRSFRLRDPDGHIVEVGESLKSWFQRLLDGGMSIEEIAEKTMMPVEVVKAMTEN